MSQKNMRVSTSGIVDNGSSVLLMLQPSQALLFKQEWLVAIHPQQVPVTELHVTLMRRSPPSGAPFPAPPAFVEFANDAFLVTEGNKTSVFLRATESSQAELAAYVKRIEEVTKTPGLRNNERVFHVSLTNLVGLPRQSVANVWECAAVPLQGTEV
jgi:hypothetical protein